ncbi:NAD(P)/FAD-dependent oxidoreductase [Flavobacterium sp. 5]|uniref:FAD-dependent oxidoreductase n=1 Tax=Flavobacterium sp. 5 TaxID=2035199 RepID=UPI000C2BF8A0|nr:NAD(P)/FAD-dependent oxidoreductase [Flavobacterium sp. 5]PKB15298.1 2-polyprenyl-6-methoxyphenol hydroxylase-like FAD-dependent oxidoreductase [Flavobacterium sp. 5]
MNLLKDKTLAIIGGGPSGLTLARLLQLKGANVKVYERDFNKNARVQGTILDLHFESGLKAIESAGLTNTFKDNYSPGADRARVVDENATLYYDKLNQESTGDFGDEWFRPEIERFALRKILLDSLQPDTVVWDSHIVSLENNTNAWKIFFENGSTATADIIIGADGANSKIRPFVTPIKPFYSGVTFLQCDVYSSEKKKIHDLLKDGKIMGYGDSRMLTIVTKNDGHLLFGASWKEDINWSKDRGIDFKDNKQVLEWFKKEYSNWDPIWHELFECEKYEFKPRPLYCMPLDQYWEAQSNITLLGDAAHLMPPFAGEGVNMAMLDALELSENLTNGEFTSLKSAIANYEKQMFARFAEIGKITMNNTEWMHSPDGLKKILLLIQSKTKNTTA